MAEFKHIVRLANTDLKGGKGILYAMKKIKGVDVMYANMALKLAGVDPEKKAGSLSDKEIEMVGKALKNPVEQGAPEWLLNRRKDFQTGDDKHLTGHELDFTQDNDIKRLKKIKSYRGLRHQWGLPVRGQRTKSNFRNSGGSSLGVRRKKKKGKKQ